MLIALDINRCNSLVLCIQIVRFTDDMPHEY